MFGVSDTQLIGPSKWLTNIFFDTVVFRQSNLLCTFSTNESALVVQRINIVRYFPTQNDCHSDY